MKKHTIIIAVLILVSCQATPQETILIGADYAMSGNLAIYGEWANNGVNLAVDKVNSEGINDREIQVIFEDSEGVPSTAVTAYHKLRTSHGINYIITYQSSIALAIAPLANEDAVIQMDVSATVPTYSTPDDFTFRTSIVATQLASHAADTLYDTLREEKVAVLFINNDFGVGMRDAFKEHYKGDILLEESFEQDASDFKTQLLKITSSGASMVFLVGHMKETGLIVSQAIEQEAKLSFFSDVYSVEGEEFLSGAGDAAEGMLYVAPKFDVTSTDEPTASFVAEYINVYGVEPNYFAAQSYDGLMAIAQALVGCSYTDTVCVQENLGRLDYEGVSGRIRFDVNGDITKPVDLKVVRNGEFVSYVE